MSLWSETAVAHTDLPATEERPKEFRVAGLFFAAWLLVSRHQPHIISHPIYPPVPGAPLLQPNECAHQLEDDILLSASLRIIARLGLPGRAKGADL
jgi:hypothetical protein